MLCSRARHSGSVGRALDWLVLGSLLAVTVLCPRARHSGSVGRALDWLSSRLSASRVTVLCPRAKHSGSVGRALDWLVLGPLLAE